MRLLKLRLHNFRRFAGDHTLDVNEELIALIGPNEAGKSSLLAALELIGRRRPPEPSDTTRGAESPASLTALYVVEDSDRDELADIPGGGEIMHAHVSWQAGRDRSTWRLEPRPQRDLAPRMARLDDVRSIESLLGSAEGDEDQWDLSVQEAATAALSSGDDSLNKSELEALDSLAQQLESWASAVEEQEDPQTHEDAPEEVREVARGLQALASIERQAPPVRLAIDALADRLPSVAAFKEQDRVLNREYALEEVTGEEGSLPPALQNLCALASIDLEQVAQLLEEGKQPQVERIFELANARLKDRFSSDWKQSDVYPRLSTPLEGTLKVMIATEDDAGYSFPEERSDGLRWFLALEAFLEARGVDHPLLVVDEAETHLHYDAQADLIDALMNQQLTAQVIYSTHSVGCLPPDLGRGIRAVLPRVRTETSSIANSYWSVDPDGDLRVGDAPVLFAMGARMLSLTIPRYGVVVEGPSDAVLLPTLLRTVTGLSSLGYRLVPGLSEVPKERLAELSGVAGTVAYLTDGDEAGERLQKDLAGAGVPVEQLLSLKSIAPGCTAEDLVDSSLFAKAVNSELNTWSLADEDIEPDQVPTIGRWRWLESQLGPDVVRRLSKVRIAQKMVDRVAAKESHEQIPYPDALRELDARLRGVLNVPGR